MEDVSGVVVVSGVVDILSGFVGVDVSVFVVVSKLVAVDVVSASVVVAHGPLHFTNCVAFVVSVPCAYLHITSRVLYPVFPQAAGHFVNSPSMHCLSGIVS